MRTERRRAPLPWYLLVHQLPPTPLYLRAKVRQRLTRAGAVALKSSVYALPRRPECLDAFHAIAEDARDGGGEAYVCEAAFPDAAAEELLVERFRAASAARFAALGARLDAAGARARAATLSGVRRRFEEAARLDYFDSPLRREIERRLEALRTALRSRSRSQGRSGARRRGGKGRPAAGRTWFTRRGIHIDRIASAWLIRRFLDPAATFRFGDPREGTAEEVTFDVPGGDFTHEEDRCTFETLVRRHGLADAALRHVAEIVHDVDVQDGKFARREAAGVERVVAGIVAGHAADADRLERGAAFFEDLYRSFVVIR